MCMWWMNQSHSYDFTGGTDELPWINIHIYYTIYNTDAFSRPSESSVTHKTFFKGTRVRACAKPQRWNLKCQTNDLCLHVTNYVLMFCLTYPSTFFLNLTRLRVFYNVDHMFRKASWQEGFARHECPKVPCAFVSVAKVHDKSCWGGMKMCKRYHITVNKQELAHFKSFEWNDKKVEKRYFSIMLNKMYCRKWLIKMCHSLSRRQLLWFLLSPHHEKSEQTCQKS